MNPRDLGGEGSRARQSFETSTSYNSLRTSRTDSREQRRGQILTFRKEKMSSANGMSLGLLLLLLSLVLKSFHDMRAKATLRHTLSLL